MKMDMLKENVKKCSDNVMDGTFCLVVSYEVFMFKEERKYIIRQSSGLKKILFICLDLGTYHVVKYSFHAVIYV